MLTRHVPNIRGHASSAGKIPDAFVKEIAEQTSLVDLVGQHVKLKKSGASFLGLCPFHSEKSPSFTVSEDKHFYHCFGCGAHGDSIRFLTDYAGMTFREAVTELAERLGRPLPSSEPGGPAPISTGPLYQRLDLAYQFFRHCLKYSDKAKEYLKGRGVTQDSLRRFAIGYAPEGWQGLQEAFPDYASDPLLLQAGLIKVKDERRYDAFRDRLIFAIKDTRGRIVGFGGRAFDDNSPPKYLNSAESIVFDKGSVLFGVHEARSAIQAAKQVIVVEGYMDVVMLAQYGVENAVASMGTACTPRQIERLGALAPEIVFTFDGDAAGIKAAWRALENCLPYASESRSFRFCILEGGKDPDDVVRTEGANAFRTKIQEAMPLSEFLLTGLSKTMNELATPEDRARFLTAGMDLIKRLPYGSPLYRIMRDEISRAANVGVAEAILMARRSGSGRARSKDETFWDALTQAVRSWPQQASEKLQEVVDSLSEEEFADLENERFSSPSEQSFWETFLSIQEMPSTSAPTDGQSGADHLVHRDLIQNLVEVLAKQRERTRKTRLSSKYRQGLITEEEFLAIRQRA
jgi:DNA primase